MLEDALQSLLGWDAGGRNDMMKRSEDEIKKQGATFRVCFSEEDAVERVYVQYMPDSVFIIYRWFDYCCASHLCLQELEHVSVCVSDSHLHTEKYL